MAITPQDIEQLTFSPSKHGYDTEEVDQFLEQLTVEVDAMLQKIADLKGRLTASDQALEAARAQVAQLQGELAAGQKQQVVAMSSVAPSTSGATEQQISQALIAAQQTADRIVSDARESADKIRTEADQKAREVIRQALAEKQNELDEIDRLKASREEFRGEYKKLLQHFMDDAETAFPNAIAQAATSSYSAPAPVPTYEVPQAEAVDVNATVYVPAQGLGGLDDLD